MCLQIGEEEARPGARHITGAETNILYSCGMQALLMKQHRSAYSCFQVYLLQHTWLWPCCLWHKAKQGMGRGGESGLMIGFSIQPFTRQLRKVTAGWVFWKAITACMISLLLTRPLRPWEYICFQMRQVKMSQNVNKDITVLALLVEVHRCDVQGSLALAQNGRVLHGSVT